MPANRSRTLEWRRCLRQVHERGGGLEIAVARPSSANSQLGEPGYQDHPHLVWRVRLLDITDREIVLEQINALGQGLEITPGVQIIAMLCIGQNRWIFTTQCVEGRPFATPDGKTVPCLRLAMPEHVQRCQRRTHYRVETEALQLPQAEVWPLLDPKSVLVAERAYELGFGSGSAALRAGSNTGSESRATSDDAAMPEVGPRFIAELLNIGGGGLGLRVAPADNQALAHHKLFWMRFNLPPALETPICATGKLVHTHMESSHDTYAGLAFDFSFNPGHQKFVVEQICRYIALQQRMQFASPAATPARRVA